MAYNKTETNYYDSLVASSYAANITGQIQRIEDAHAAIRSKAIELGLTIPAGKQLTHNASGTTNLALAATHHILDTAAAINNISINKDTNKTLQAGTVYTVPVGYNAVAYTITSKALADQTQGDAYPLDILVGKTAWVNGSEVHGTMANLAGNQDASSIGTYKNDSGDDCLYLEIPKDGKYTAKSQLRSNIKLITPDTAIEIPVTVRTKETGETIFDTSKLDFDAGYYPKNFNIKAVFETTGLNEVINIATSVAHTLSLQKGNLSVPNGFDYLAKTASYEIQSGSLSLATFTTDVESGAVYISGHKVSGSGWLDAVDYTKETPVVYTPNPAKYTVDNLTGLATVTTAGWVVKGTTAGGLKPGSATLSPITQASSATTIGSTNINAGLYYVKLTKTAGYISAGESAINLGLASMSSATSSDERSGTKITTKGWKVTTSQGYNHSPQTTNLYVQDGVLNPEVTIDKNYKCTLNVTQSGWIGQQTVKLEIDAADQTYQLKESDLASVDRTGSEVVIQAAEGTLMKSISIDTSIIYSKLVSI